MKTIYKYPLKIEDYQEIELPLDATILSVQMQRDEPYLWASIDIAVAATSKHIIRIHGTGRPIEPYMNRYINTIQTLDGYLVWHAFEEL